MAQTLICIHVQNAIQIKCTTNFKRIPEQIAETFQLTSDIYYILWYCSTFES